MEPNNPARPWQELAEKTAHEQDPKKIVELAQELIRAFDEQQTSPPPKIKTSQQRRFFLKILETERAS